MSEREKNLGSGEPSIDSMLRAVARAPADATAAIEPGNSFGPFAIERVLGRGAHGSVYLARDTRLSREVALKIPRHEGDEERRRFLREARVAANAAHPGVAMVYEVGEHDGHAYIAMEYVRGESLRTRLKRREVSAADARRMLLEIANAVAAAHAKGIVHRDLKPENVIVAEDGTLHVVDFGLAKELERLDPHATGDAATMAGDVIGTPGYMAPEQIAGEPADARADVFALGVIGYELFKGERPFRGRTPFEVAAATTRDEPAPLPEGRVGALASVLLRCLAKRPSDRYADARDLVAALSTTSPAHAARRWTAAGIAVFVVIVLVGARASRSSSASNARSTPTTELQTPRLEAVPQVEASPPRLAKSTEVEPIVSTTRGLPSPSRNPATVATARARTTAATPTVSTPPASPAASSVVPPPRETVPTPLEDQK